MYTAHQITRKDVESIGARVYATTSHGLPSTETLTECGWERLGSNAGTYGLNWTAWLSKDHGTVLLTDAYRNAPKSTAYVDRHTAYQIAARA